MYIYSIYGYGKGKTESSIGMVIRALANDHKVLFTQFLKDGNSSEVMYLKDKIDIMSSNTDKIVLPKNKTQEERNKIFEDIIKDEWKKQKWDINQDKYNEYIKEYEPVLNAFEEWKIKQR